MGIFDAIIQGIVQGLTEFLPVSSSGHVSLVQHFTGVNLEGAQAFTLFLHFGTLAAVFIAYRKLIGELIIEFFNMVRDLFTGKFIWKLDKMSSNRRMVIMVFIASACALLLFLPLFGIFGVYDSQGELVKNLADVSAYVSEDPDITVEGICLLITGALLLFATKLSNEGKSKSKSITVKNALSMGIGQSFAALPGLSRSGTTTTLGMITGLEKNAALQFSFIMGIPAVLGGNLKELMDMSSADWADFEILPVIIGIIVSAAVGILAIAGLKWIVSNDKLHYFGYYCLAVGIVIVIIGIIEHINGVTVVGNPMSIVPAISGDDVISAGNVVSAGDIAVSVSDVVSSSALIV